MLQSQVRNSFASTDSPHNATASRGTAPREKESDAFLDHYFKRIDPAVAGSFTPEQRDAIKAMFGARGIARHSVELRTALPIFWRRYYLVLLMGRERRALSRLFGEGSGSYLSETLGYAITAGLCLAPLAILLVILKIGMGIDLLP